MAYESRETMYRTRERIGADGYTDTPKRDAFVTNRFPTHARAVGDNLYFGRVFASEPDELAARAQISWDGQSVLRALYWWKKRDRKNGIFIESTVETPYHQEYTVDTAFNALEVVSMHNRTELSFGTVLLTNCMKYKPVDVELSQRAVDTLVIEHIDKFTCGKISRIDEGLISISA